MSLWQFQACVDGYAKAHGAEDHRLDDRDADRMLAAMERLGLDAPGPLSI